jgi:hypothetical protein
MKPTFPLLFLTLFGLNIGCDTLHQYDISVTNRLTQPVTVWLTKHDGPYENGWAPPEYLSLDSTADTNVGGVVIQPGDTCHTQQSTKMKSDNQAILRIYRAANFNEVLALSPGNPDRLDVPLQEGKTDIDVIRQDDQLAVRPHAPAQ